MGTTTSSIGVVTAIQMKDRTVASSAMTTEVLELNTTTIAPTTCKELSRASKETAEVGTITNAEVAAAANLGVEAEAGLM